jgi:hypothetical protein
MKITENVVFGNPAKISRFQNPILILGLGPRAIAKAIFSRAAFS